MLLFTNVNSQSILKAPVVMRFIPQSSQSGNCSPGILFFLSFGALLAQLAVFHTLTVVFAERRFYSAGCLHYLTVEKCHPCFTCHRKTAKFNW